VTFSREMLDAAPVELDVGLAEVAEAIDASAACAQACTSCANSCLGEPDVADLSRCTALCSICSDVCEATVRVLSQPVHSDRSVWHQLLEACVRTCKTSAEECERHAAHHRHCAICLKACRACIKACESLLEAEAFEELRKLAGA
jgi:hypothetical protein